MSDPPAFTPGPWITGKPATTDKPPPGPSLDKKDPKTTNPAANARQQVDLAVALFMIEATYKNPQSGGPERKPVPPHQWMLFDPSADKIEPIALGARSDDTGVSAIRKAGFVGVAGKELALLLVPIDPEVRKSTFEYESAFIDVESGEWVTFPQAMKLKHRKRPLIYMPLWRSDRKATRGGLVDGPTEDFKKTGKLRGEDLAKEYGAPGAPWRVHVDHEWLRARLKLMFFNWKSGKEEPVPPGLLVEAVSAKGTTAGAGTATESDGTVCVQFEVTAEQALKLEFQFQFRHALEPRYVDLTAKSPKDAVQSPPTGKPIPEKAIERYALPDLWRSAGMEARAGTPSAAREPFEDLRKKLKPGDEPTYVFHLDDFVIEQLDGKLATVANARVTLFDQLLAIRDRDGSAPDLSKPTIKRNYFRAEDAYFQASAPAAKALAKTTRLVHHEGLVYHLAEERVADTAKGRPCVGLRVAKESTPASKSGYYEVHLVGSFVDDFDYAKKKVKLAHLFVFASVYVDPIDPGVDPGATPPDLTNQGNVAPNADVAKVHALLDECAVRWDQVHPAYGSTSKKKDYAIVPSTGPKDGGHVVKVRHFFGRRSAAGTHKFVIHLQTKTKYGDRAYVSGGTDMYLIVSKAGPSTGDTASDPDGASEPWFTLAHEFGHVISYPDEYAENVAVKDVNTSMAPRLPVFTQSGGDRGKAFNADHDAMMQSNKLPRLRYVWNQILKMKERTADGPWLTTEGPEWLAEYAGFDGGIRHKTPLGNTSGPWSSFAPQRMGRSDVIVWPVGDDEGTLTLFSKNGQTIVPKNQRIDGIAVVRTRFWFTFAGNLDDEERFGIMYKFQKKVHADRMSLSFVAVAADAAHALKRIGVYFQPHYEFGPQPYGGAVAGNADVRVLAHNENVFIDVFSPVENTLRRKVVPDPVSLGEGDVELSLYRYGLGVPHLKPGTDKPWNGRVTAAELTGAGLGLAISRALSAHEGGGGPKGPVPRSIVEV